MIVRDTISRVKMSLTSVQVSKYFSDVFNKLVPSGHAQLVMKTAVGDEEDDGTAEPADSDRFIGVGKDDKSFSFVQPREFTRVDENAIIAFRHKGIVHGTSSRDAGDESTVRWSEVSRGVGADIRDSKVRSCAVLSV